MLDVLGIAELPEIEMCRWSLAVVYAFILLMRPATAAPLAPECVPEPLKPWIGWALHGKEMAACPPAFNDAASRGCAWPSELELRLNDSGASFRFQVHAFAPDTPIELPGDGEAWPQDVRVDAQAAAVTQTAGRPTLRLAPGAHAITGTLSWPALPPNVSIPRAAGLLRLTLRGEPFAGLPDGEGRLWLQRATEPQGADALTVRAFRLIEDAVPLTSTVRYELAVSGKPRELRLPHALLAGFVPLAIDSPLPARIDADGNLYVQARAGTWTVSVGSRLMSSVQALELPGSADFEEVWSFQPHNEVRLITFQGPPAVDPKTVAMPAEWHGFPAFLLRPGATLKLTEARRGEAGGEPDRLTLTRHIWLDFDGGGYTIEDRLGGTLSRSWRLEAISPFVLGRAAVDGQDQPITRLMEDGPAGIEVRRGTANIQADSRVESDTRTLPAAGWRADISAFAARLELPPGWRLLHVSGVDRAQGAWLANWSLWDMFFAVLIAFAGTRLFGIVTGVVLGLALALTWHTPGAPGLPWLALLASHAIATALPEGRLRRAANVAKVVSGLVILAMLLPFAVSQIRQAIYPALEMPYQQMGAVPVAAPAPVAVPAEAEPQAGLASGESYAARNEDSRLSKSTPMQAKHRADSAADSLTRIDPTARVQTGPGLPAWTWRSHELRLQGPVASEQSLHLVLLPPWGSALWSLASVVLLALALWRCTGLPPGAASASLRRLVTRAAPAALVICAGIGAAPDGSAATPPPAPRSMPAPQVAAEDYPPTPPPAILDELRERLIAPPECMPACAELARLAIVADERRVQLRLELHAQADVAVPLPGQATQWRAATVLVDARPAALRRDEQGILWAHLTHGVHQVVMDAPAGASARIALPMAPRRITSELKGWILSGIDARGLASGMIELVREQPATQAEEDKSAGRDRLPPFVRVERHLSLGQRWSVATRIVRVGPSLAPLTVRVPLLEGEGVTDASVKVEGGEALVNLGAQSEALFTSSLEERPRLRLSASRTLSQVERWILDPTTQWHVTLGGIPPVHNRVGDRWLPTWMPWPGEEVSIEVARPKGIEGTTLTFDVITLRVTPGQRSAEASAEASVRTSRGGNHAFELPESAQLLAVAVDGQVQPVRADERKVSVPLLPGAHTVKIDWREPLGMAWRYQLPRLDLGSPAVNAGIELAMPNDRVVLAVLGPRLGPAVLLWGVLAVVLAAAWALARSALAPLGFVSWAMLGIGLAQASVVGAFVVVGWFLALAARARCSAGVADWRFNAMQIGLALWTLIAAAILFATLRTGLLGFPDLMIQGNGSSAFLLRWFADRSEALTPQAEVYTVPVFAYRLVMLAWALWLTVSLMKWLRWAWSCYTTQGYWRELKRAPRPGKEPAAEEEAADLPTQP